MLFPGNRNQQHVGACIFFELKWAKYILPNLAHIEKRYNVSRRILQRARARLSIVGLIEHVSYSDSRYGGQHGWRLSTRFERTLNQLSTKCADYRNTATDSKEKEILLLEFTDARRKIPPSQNQHIPGTHFITSENRVLNPALSLPKGAARGMIWTSGAPDDFSRLLVSVPYYALAG